MIACLVYFSALLDFSPVAGVQERRPLESRPTFYLELSIAHPPPASHTENCPCCLWELEALAPMQLYLEPVLVWLRYLID